MSEIDLSTQAIDGILFDLSTRGIAYRSDRKICETIKALFAQSNRFEKALYKIVDEGTTIESREPLYISDNVRHPLAQIAKDALEKTGDFSSENNV